MGSDGIHERRSDEGDVRRGVLWCMSKDVYAVQQWLTATPA